MLGLSRALDVAMVELAAIKFVLRFATHIVLGGALFAFVAAMTILMHWVIDRILDGAGTMPYVRSAIEGVELFIFAADLVCVVAFVVKETWILLKSLLIETPSPHVKA
jgi:hypothetical protein